jgi:hypothetical protein
VDPSGTVLEPATQVVTSPLQVTAKCTILDLVLGPLHLDLLGLVVDLNQVHLLITAEQGQAICWATCCARLRTC